jgi:uncharacterized protein (TIGR02453 family)
MNFNDLFSFLEELQRNNHKEWMDDHRKEYQAVRNQYIDWLNQMDQRLQSVDPDYKSVEGRKALNRINNNLLFHPNKPVYKDHFGAGLDQSVGKQGDFYIHLGCTESFLAGGYWRPKKDLLDSIRDAIDYDGSVLKTIMNKPSFKKTFQLVDTGDDLKSAPKGFSKDHEHIDLLKKKTFAVIHPLSRKRILQPHFMDHCIEVYLEMKPFRDYLNKAITV